MNQTLELTRGVFREVPRARVLFGTGLFLHFMTSLAAVTLMGASAWLLSRRPSTRRCSI